MEEMQVGTRVQLGDMKGTISDTDSQGVFVHWDSGYVLIIPWAYVCHVAFPFEPDWKETDFI